MKIVIVGPGALGSLVSGLLKHKTKEDVWLLDKYEDRGKRLKGSGVRIEGIGGSLHAMLNVTARAEDIGLADLVIICVKSYSTEDACKGIKCIVGENTRVLSLQNGIGNVQILNDHFGEERVIAGVTNHGATLLDVGRVRHAGKGDTVIGTASGRVLGEIRNVAVLLTRAGFETKISKDIDSVVWSKLIVNVGINALTAVTRLRNGMLVEIEDARAIMRSAVQEAVKVAKRKRVKLTYDDAIQKVESVCKATADNASSMLQDVRSRKRTEIEFINGAIVRQGKALGIPTPVNEVLSGLVRTIESSYDLSGSRN
jgi:2-dehydropantoate 2-reductase